MTLEDYNPDDVFQAMFIPRQKPPSPPTKDNMIVTSYPPLGQLTILPTNSKLIDFTVLLEVDQIRDHETWEVAIWYLTVENTWEDLLLERIKQESSIDNVISTLQENVEKTSAFYFKGNLPITIHHSPSFTIRFRSAADQPWRWVRDHHGQDDGVVVLQPSTNLAAASQDLGEYIQGLNPDFKAKSAKSQSPGTLVWDLTASVKPAGEELSNYEDIVLGKPWGGYSRYVREFGHKFMKCVYTLLN